MSRSPSLAGRAVLALVLMVGFYLLALAIAGVLLWIPYAEVVYAHRLFLKPTLLCLLGAGIILWSVVPRPDRFTPPGPTLEPQAQPRLFELIRSVAQGTRQVMPAEVYLLPDVNAWVTSRGGLMGIGSRRIMGIGLPLLQALEVSELRGVLAHEFGHYHGGDVALGPWIYGTRATIGRTLQGLSHHSGLLQKPFHWYGVMFLRVTHAISRAQEYAADALAARVAGPAAMKSGLRHIAGAAAAHAAYWRGEFEPLLAGGFRAPWLSGFQRFLSRAPIEAAVSQLVHAQETEGHAGAYDTHPSLRERIAALDDLPEGAELRDQRPAVALLDDVAGLERQLLDHLVVPQLAARLVDLPWEDVAARALLPSWQRALAAQRETLAGELIGALPARDIDALARTLRDVPAAAPPESRREFARWLLGAGISLALARHGGTVRSLPGEPVTVTMPTGEVEPFAWAGEIGTAELDPAGWRERCRRHGIEDEPLLPPGTQA